MGNLLDFIAQILAEEIVIYSWHNCARTPRLSSSVVEQPPCKRQVVSSILTGGSIVCYLLFLINQSRVSL